MASETTLAELACVVVTFISCNATTSFRRSVITATSDDKHGESNNSITITTTVITFLINSTWPSDTP